MKKTKKVDFDTSKLINRIFSHINAINTSRSLIALIATFAFTIQLSVALNCPSNTWTCNNKFQCINATLRCNSVVDCDDGSDEGVTCSKYTNVKIFFVIETKSKTLY